MPVSERMCGSKRERMMSPPGDRHKTNTINVFRNNKDCSPLSSFSQTFYKPSWSVHSNFIQLFTLELKTRTMLLIKVMSCLLPIIASLRTQRSSGTLVDFTDPKVQGHLDALVRMAQSCVIKVRATPKDVRAYFTNSSPVSRSGQCFAACMLEQSDVINHGKVNRELLVHLTSLVNGKNSRVVRKLNTVSRLCLDSIEGMSDRCQLASTYNDCLNENMIEFAFPLDIAEEAVRKMPFHLIQPKLPKVNQNTRRILE
ncbi:hypothetical protein HW555_002170 [Spodoptera exigua]|uniref:Uncharacterized protein n=1 Tax=Spodoptera exigua TaxID=7107 RepID=A0A835GPE6_SPOEX|nr:hypothetical protein HW555_002170 [Spodoptera exigua]